MPDKPREPTDRFDRIEAAQKELLAAATKLESRVEILHREFQRAATAVRRVRLAQDNGNAAARRREEALSEIRAQLTRIEALLAER